MHKIKGLFIPKLRKGREKYLFNSIVFYHSGSGIDRHILTIYYFYPCFMNNMIVLRQNKLIIEPFKADRNDKTAREPVFSLYPIHFSFFHIAV